MRKRYEMQGSETDPLEEYKNYEAKKRKDSIHSLSPLAAIIFVIALTGLYGIVCLIDGILPTPLTVADEKDSPGAFITERAQHDLKLLTSLGPRVVGSYENEELAVDLLKRELTLVQQQAHQNQKVEFDVQMVSGAYFLDFKPHGCINAYGNVQNVVAKLHGRNNSEHSLLVNCHFDSVPTSPGGSDDGINCAVMLEVLRKLSRSPNPPQHNVLFLFNGAEETPLQASHGFITQHKWAKEAKVFVNLEAAGAGGREILFQTGPNRPWLVDYYQNVPHPHGQAAGEEIFQSGIIPSDTDFRIFRDFGGAIGLDFAFARNGYRYHTKYDDFKNIPLGSYQHVGDNALYLIRALANAPELANPKEQPSGKAVFYDFLGLFMICYSETTATVVNVLVSMFSFIVVLWTFYDLGLASFWMSSKYLSLATGAVLLGWILSVGFVFLTAIIIDFLKFTMSWYNSPWIIIGLYAVPIVACSSIPVILLNKYSNKNNLSVGLCTQLQLQLVRLIWTMPLLVGTILGFRFVYAIMIPVLFHFLSFAVIQLFSLQHTIRKWQIVYIVGMLIPTVFSMQQAIEISSLVVPTCGRIGPDRNPELYVAVLTFIVTILTTSFYVPLVTLVRKPKVLLSFLAGVFLVFLIIVFTPLGFPYSGDSDSPAPQRFWIYHMSRKFHGTDGAIYKKDSGFFLLNMDRNSPRSVEKYVKDLSKVKSVAEDCDRSLFCGLTLASPRMIAILRKSTWIPAEQPIIHEPLSLKLNSKTSISKTITRYNFTSSGPSRQAVYVSAKPNATLLGTSLVPELPPDAIIWNERPTYAILYTWGKQNTPFTFSLDFETPENWTGPTFDIALDGKHVHDRLNVKTPHYLQFLGEFPQWADVTAWLGAYESWMY